MESLEILRVIFALFAVVGMIGICALIAKKSGLAASGFMLAREKRLSLIETLPLDKHRKAAIIRVDQNEHLVILNANSVTVVERSLTPVLASGDLNPVLDSENPVTFDDALNTLKSISNAVPSIDPFEYDTKLTGTK